MDFLQAKLDKRKKDNSLRALSDGSKLVDFCSNNYLGLERNLKQAEIENEINRSGSRLLSGNSDFKLQVENQIALHHGAERALVYSSGYLANVGLISAVVHHNDTIVYDALCHASIRDGIRLSQAANFSFKHNDASDLSERLDRVEGRCFVIVESVYSMDGDLAPLSEISKVCRGKDIHLIVDEAHSNGVYGKQGAGLVSELGLENEVFARNMTFGKALGYHGAAIVASKTLIDYLVNFSRPFIYTTAPDEHFFKGLSLRYEALKSDQQRNEFEEVKQYFETQCKQYDLPVQGGGAGIYTLICSGNDAVKALASIIHRAGYDVRAILSPTVPLGAERLRICLHAYNTRLEIDGLINVLV